MHDNVYYGLEARILFVHHDRGTFVGLEAKFMLIVSHWILQVHP